MSSNNLWEEVEFMKERQLNSWDGDTPIQLYYKRKIPTFKLTNEQYQKWSGPIVYICWKFITIDRNNKHKIAIYVGMSSHGMARPLGRDHHRKNIIETANVLEILPCYSIEDALEIEKELIKYLRPNNNLKQKIKPRQISLNISMSVSY